MQEKIKVYAQTQEEEARFRGKHLQKAIEYFPKLSEWCPPIYINATPPGGRLATHHYVPPSGNYIYLAAVDVIEGWDDFYAQTEYFHHEAAHIVEMKFMGRTVHTCDERFARAVHQAVNANNKLLYVVLSQIMGI